MNVHHLGKLSAALTRQATLVGLKAVVTTDLLRLLPADELVVDVASFALSRPALIRHGVDPAWAKVYNETAQKIGDSGLAVGLALQGRVKPGF
jgi:hypothetical protein